MTHKWTKDDLAALDALLDKFPPTEIATKAKGRTRRGKGRPKHDWCHPHRVWNCIEMARTTGNFSVQEAAEKIASIIAREWKKPISAKSLVRIHREHCRRYGFSPTARAYQRTMSTIMAPYDPYLAELDAQELEATLKKSEAQKFG
jgi:hypothetical protein